MASEDEFAAFFKRQPHHPGPAAAGRRVWEQLQRPQLRADAITVRTKSRLMLALVAQLVAHVAQIAAYDAEIRGLFARHPDAALFAGLPGTGKRLAPRLLAEWGDDRARYANASALQALAGTAPVPYARGRTCRARKRYACVKPLRNALYQFAWQSTAQEVWALQYYRRKRSEGKTHNVALRALANQWAPILYALWRKRVPYEAAVFLAAQQAHGQRAA